MEEGKQSLPNEISAVLIRWYETHRRELPWRETTDPYRIWISEIILQQTRVAQGLEYYLRFVERFPDVRSLAGAHEDEVMKLWQGLGYYSRARNLHAAAREVSGKYAGLFPADYASVRALKGIGDYTAAAICSFAFGLPHATVDGNVYRVLARLYGLETPIDTPAGKREFAVLAGFAARSGAGGTAQPGDDGVRSPAVRTALARLHGLPAGRPVCRAQAGACR